MQEMVIRVAYRLFIT